jgi:hypothetical protein
VKKRLPEAEVVRLLAAAVDKEGSQSALSRKWKMTQTYISQVLMGNKRPGQKICRRLGVTVTKQWVYLKENA